MDKVLVLATYREDSGWGQAARNYILAMDSVGIDVVCRPIRIRPEHNQPPNRILSLESKSAKDCNIVIQHILPHLMEYDGRFDKNIGLFVSETTNFGRCSWINKLNLMDEVWTATQSSVDCAKRSGLIPKAEVIPHAEDISKYSKGYEKLQIDAIGEDTFTFYTIAELTPRKNIESLLVAFHTEFRPHEDVALLVKTSIMGRDANTTSQVFSELADGIKNTMRLYGYQNAYHPEIIITQRLNDDQMNQLHVTGDVFVCTSCGEGWNMPSFDSLGFGNPVITTDINSCGYINDKNGWLVKSHVEPVLFRESPLSDIYTSHENWHKIDILDLRSKMREVFENRELVKTKGNVAKESVKDYSYEKIGNLIKDKLNGTQ